MARTFADTVLYASVAGVLSTALGFSLAIAIGRFPRLRGISLLGLFLLLSLPPSLAALGTIKLSTALPGSLDPLLRSRLTVGVVSALRFFPIAALLGIRSFGATAPSQALAAAVHGISLWAYLRRVLASLLSPSAGVAVVLVALLSTAEVNIVLLLRPPGADSLPVQIFTIMANAPESLVAALCFLYTAGAATLLLALWTLAPKPRHS